MYIIYILYIYIYIYIYISGVYGSVGHPKASKQKVPGSTPGSFFFSCVYQELNKR